MSHSLLLAATGNPLTDVTTAFGVDWPKFGSQVFLFLAVAFALKKFAFGPIQTVLEERRQKIAEGLANAEKTRKELATAQAKASEILTQAGQQATKIIEETRQAAAKISEQEAQKAVAAANEIIAKAKLANESELTRMKGELRKEFGRLVVAAAGKASGKVLTFDDQKRLADEANQQLAA
jgi:F-type H+-transporting ATPase subunit b